MIINGVEYEGTSEEVFEDDLVIFHLTDTSGLSVGDKITAVDGTTVYTMRQITMISNDSVFCEVDDEHKPKPSAEDEIKNLKAENEELRSTIDTILTEVIPSLMGV